MKRLLLMGALTLVCPVHAANIWTTRGDCGTDKEACTTIHIEGTIKENDYRTFDNIVGHGDMKITNALIKMDSPGGELTSGLTIGAIIFANGFSTFVDQDTLCSSVCALMWLAGKERYATPKSNIGFHGPYIQYRDRNGRAVGSPKPNPGGLAVVKFYLTKIGISEAAQGFMTSGSPEQMFWLNNDLAKGFHLEYTSVEGTPKPKIQEATGPKASPKSSSLFSNHPPPVASGIPPCLATRAGCK